MVSVREIRNRVKINTDYKKPVFLFIVLSLLLNFFLAFYVINNQKDISAIANLESLSKKYPLLSKRVLQDYPQDLLINFLSLRNDIRERTSPWGADFAMYFEYLPTGTSIGINSTQEFYAASLFKVPAIMAYYKNIERLNNKSDLDNQITIQDQDIDTKFGDLWKKGAGFTLTNREAIRLALEESDNTAAKLIAKQISQNAFEEVYQGLDIDLNTGSGGALLTAKSYSSILKALFFSSVLDKDDSHQVLNYLSRSKFNDKLVSGVPGNIQVVHKIGDYRDNKNNTAYMDCGIVYVPRRPYLLCMLSVGSNDLARQRMQTISKSIYDYVAKIK